MWPITTAASRLGSGQAGRLVTRPNGRWSQVAAWTAGICAARRAPRATEQPSQVPGGKVACERAGVPASACGRPAAMPWPRRSRGLVATVGAACAVHAAPGIIWAASQAAAGISSGCAPADGALQLAELVGAALMYGDAAWDEVQLEAVDGAVGDADAILLRDVERQAPATTGCCVRRPSQAADVVLLEHAQEEFAEHLRGDIVEMDPLGIDRLAQLFDESVKEPHVSLVPTQFRIEDARYVDVGQVDDRHGLGGDEPADGEEVAGEGRNG